jgi:23S rRNA (adenine2503-C2)-methyltransferase
MSLEQTEKINVFNYTFTDLQEIFVEKGMTKFATNQVFDWIYKKLEFNPENWTNISKKNREILISEFTTKLPVVLWDGLSKDGTRKFLLKLEDKNTIETVAIAAPNRLTLCISSQVGCAIGCTFCHTGTQGLTRHLKTHEIIGQYMAISKWLKMNVNNEDKLTNIVYMGQGEPLHNYDNVKDSAELFIEVKGLGLGQRRITLSTSGLVPAIKKLIDFPPVNLAISLHSARNEQRTELMPINKVYDLERLFEAIRSIPLKAHRRITYEYLLIDGLNDTAEDIEALNNLLIQKESKINLIPFNEYPESHYKRPSKNRIMWFMDQLIKKGFVCTVRATKGDDILAACGQLKTQYEKLNLWEAPQA